MYMVQQQTTTAIREGYAEADTAEVERELAGAVAARTWLEGLTVDADARATLIEPIAAVEEALAECLRRKERSG